MSITDGPIFDPGPSFYIGPVESAMSYIDHRRLHAAVLAHCIPSYFAPNESPISLGNCFRYLTRIGMKNWDCTCKVRTMRSPPEGAYAKHGENCGVTPEYAKLCKEMNVAPELRFSVIKMSMWYLDWDTWDQSKIKEMKWQ